MTFIIRSVTAKDILETFLEGNLQNLAGTLFLDATDGIYKELAPPYFIALDLCNSYGYTVNDKILNLITILTQSTGTPLVLPSNILSTLATQINQHCLPFKINIIPSQMDLLLFSSKTNPELLFADNTVSVPNKFCPDPNTMKYICCGCCGQSSANECSKPSDQNCSDHESCKCSKCQKNECDCKKPHESCCDDEDDTCDEKHHKKKKHSSCRDDQSTHCHSHWQSIHPHHFPQQHHHLTCHEPIAPPQNIRTEPELLWKVLLFTLCSFLFGILFFSRRRRHSCCSY